MATSAFKSTSKRSSFSNSPDDASSATNSSSNGGGGGGERGHRRSRSLSRFSGRLYRGRNLDLDSDEPPPPQPQLTPRGRFVNTIRGSDGFPQLTLEDLANDFFPATTSTEREEEDSHNGRGRSSRRHSSVGPPQGQGRPRPRPRSVSRQRSRPSAAAAPSPSIAPANTDNSSSRRRRSLSVAPHHFTDSESDHDQLSYSTSTRRNANIGRNASASSAHNPPTSSHQRVLKRSVSLKELSKFQDGYSSHSSALTDEEIRDIHSHKDAILRSFYALEKTGYPIDAIDGTSSYKAMQKELIEEMKMELKHPSGLASRDRVHSSNLNVIDTLDLIREKCRTKLVQSEKWKQDLLAEMVLEEQRGRELSKIVQEILPETRNSVVPETPSGAKMKSNEKSSVSQRLTEEAEKYFEDFLSNVEDTDISSMDGEKSDASSKFGVKTKLPDHGAHCQESGCVLKLSTSTAVEMDGVMLPWLRWGTSDVPVTPQRDLHDRLQGASPAYSKSNFPTSSHGSWSPGGESASAISREDRGSRYSRQFAAETDEHLYSQSNEEIIFECWRQRLRRDSGGLILCSGAFL